MERIESRATGLQCIGCTAQYPLNYLLECPRCQGLLELHYDLTEGAKRGPSMLSGGALWRYAAFLPIRDPAHRVSLGEGQTPLLEAPRLAAVLGVRWLLLKFEGSNPTGTVKDRSSATAVAAARQFGYPAISVVSTGNAGSSIAAYASRAGLRAFIFCYERASPAKLAHMAACASDLIFYQGVYDDLITIWDRVIQELPIFDGGASRNAYKQEGKKTLAYEWAEQTGFRPPATLVLPVAVGEVFIAAWRGLSEMTRMGWIERPPRLVAAQAARSNPIVTAFNERRALTPLKIGYTVAEGLACGNPERKGEWVLKILRESGGLAADAEDEEILEAQRLLAHTEGIYAGPTGCATLAVLVNLLRAKKIDPDEPIGCVISETGLKSEVTPVTPQGIIPTYEGVKTLLLERLAQAPSAEGMV